MRRIKTYVMTVGVALSVAPIFNYALAQQGGSSTELLLQVQTMRQEIAELRDMVERQQFQLKRLQKQVDTQSKQLTNPQSLNQYGPTNVAPSNQDGFILQPDGSVLQTRDTFPQAYNSTSQTGVDNTAPNTVISNSDTDSIIGTGEQTNWDSARAQGTNDINQTNGVAQAGSQEVATGAQGVYANPNSVTTQPSNQSNSYPPVVDRSFETATSAVPVTGAGTIQGVANTPRSLPNQASNPLSQQPLSQSEFDQRTLEQTSRAQDYRAQAGAGASSSNGVIAVPTRPSVGASGGVPIDASQVPTQVPVNRAPQVVDQVAISNSQSVASQRPQPQELAPLEPAPLVVSEDDYYGQGFELLKQSKYEEAAEIFKQQLQAHPKGDLADDAHYWIAEAMHVSRKLDVAKVHLKAIINDYPQSRRLPDAMLKTAYIEQSQGNQIEARILFQEIVNSHPQSDAAIAAKNQLATTN